LSGVESVVFDSALGKQLACCPFVRKVLSSRSGSPRSYNVWNVCSLNNDSHCDFDGKRLKFESFGIDSLKVAWVCPRIVDFSFLEGGVRG
jgi:hypothetical protein